MPNLYVIRHAYPEIIPDVPAPKWSLSERGHAESAQLAKAESWPDMDLAAVWHSAEPKAKETGQYIAEAANAPLCFDPGLDELEFNNGFLSQEAFKQRVGDYLSGDADDPAFENYEMARARIVASVERIMSAAEGRSAAIVSHGRILTVLYSHLLGRRLGRDEWKQLKFADLSVIDWETKTVERGFWAHL